MTPEEIANKLNNGSGGHDAARKLFISGTARELQRFIACVHVNSHWYNDAQASLQIRLSEDAAASASKIIQHTEKLTQQTDKLVTESVNLSSLTKVLIWLTIALGLFAVIQIVLMFWDIFKVKH